VDVISHNLGLNFDERLAIARELNGLQSKAEQLLSALAWKKSLPEDFPIIICLVGGTGTGKSTIFNSIAGHSLSKVGPRRPCTKEAVALVPKTWEQAFLTCPLIGQKTSLQNPANGTVIDLQTTLEDLGFILVDTPDFDSVELHNRIVAEGFFNIADLVIFVTSQEKYGDMSGLRVRDEAARWGKTTFVIMNKVASDSAFEDFLATLKESKLHLVGLIRLERMENSPDHIEGLRERPEILQLSNLWNKDKASELRTEELGRLQTQVVRTLGSLVQSTEIQIDRIHSINDQIEQILKQVQHGLNDELDAVVSAEVKNHINERLHQVLRKYDIFFGVRNTIRSTIQKAFGSLQNLVLYSFGRGGFDNNEENRRKKDVTSLRSAVRLKPLETAMAQLNRKVSELLSSDPRNQDLIRVMQNDVPRWDESAIRERFDEAFPGVEKLLEAEFNHFKEGLTRTDQAKLYGSYTLWALLMITAEIVLGGGFTLLDAMFNTAIFPFIPKWVLRLKIMDLLRHIANRLNMEYRRVQHGILRSQTEVYYSEFTSLIPTRADLARVRDIQQQLN
jgi:GTPase SAR1 family protein